LGKIAPGDFGNAFSELAYLAVKRVPYLTAKEIRSGMADTAAVVQVVKHDRVYTFRFNANSNALDDSATVICAGNRRYVINAENLTPEMFGAKGDGVTKLSILVS
jgi:hypothetical protein